MNQEMPSFAGLRVAAFESRQAGEMTRMIASFGGVPRVSPSLREVPLEENRAAIDFAHHLITGQVDCVVFLTGVGFRQLLAVVERHVDRQRYLDALADVVTIARGPKPVLAMKEVGLTPRVRVPEPNTWRELLQTIDQETPVKNLTVAVQEYGKPNPSLIAGLEARGARVISVPVYRWELPTDVGPLRDNVTAIAAGECDVVMFTSAHQVVNLLLVADQLGVAREVRRQFDRMAVVSVGPATSEALQDHDLPVDIEPEHPKMGPMVQAAARRSREVIERKREAGALRIESAESTGGNDAPASWHDSPFLKACRREPTPFTPVFVEWVERFLKG